MDNINKNKKKQKLLFYGLISFLALLTTVLLILPATFFDSGQSICVSMLLFNKECYGCGMTRAIQHLIHFDFKSAYDYNKLSFIVFPMFVYLTLVEVRKIYFKIK